MFVPNKETRGTQKITFLGLSLDLLTSSAERSDTSKSTGSFDFVKSLHVPSLSRAPRPAVHEGFPALSRVPDSNLWATDIAGYTLCLMPPRKLLFLLTEWHPGGV